MKNRICVVTVFVLLFNYSFAQVIKNYSGTYLNGTAKYEYYENADFERIYHGSFNATITLGQWNTNPCIIKGNFDNNQRVGNWTFNSNFNKVIGSYSSGKLNGKWEYYDIKEGKSILISTCTFKDDKIIGNFIYNYKASVKSIILDVKMAGILNENGYLEGEWKITYKDIEDIRKYSNGILYWQLQRNIQTGEILKKYDNSAFVLEFSKNYNVLTNSSIVDSLTYYLSVIPRQSTKKDILEYAFDFWTNGGDTYSNHNIVYSYEFKELKGYNKYSYNYECKPVTYFVHNEYTKGKEELVNEQNELKAESIKINASTLYNQKKYKECLIELKQAYFLFPTTEIKNDLVKVENAIKSENQIVKGDSLFRLMEYNASLTAYLKAQDFLYSEETSMKIKEVELSKKQKQYEYFVSQGNNYMQNKKFLSTIKSYKLAQKEISTKEIDSLINISEKLIIEYKELAQKINSKYEDLFYIESKLIPKEAEEEIKPNLKPKYYEQYQLCITDFQNKAMIPKMEIKKYRQQNSIKLISFENGDDWDSYDERIRTYVNDLATIIEKMEKFHNSVKQTIKTNDKVKLNYFKENDTYTIIELFTGK